MTLLLFALTAIALGAGLATLIGSIRHRGGINSPKLLFVGFKRAAFVLLIGLLLPIGVYFLYSRFAPFSHHKYGLNYHMERFALESVLLCIAVLILTFAASFVMIRRRCIETGIKVPETSRLSPTRTTKIATAILLILLIAYYLTWQSELGLLLGWFTVAYTVLACILWFLGQDLRITALKHDFDHFRGTFFRSLTPILAGVILILGLTASFYLTNVERVQVRQLNVPGVRLFIDEIDYTGYKYYRDHLAEEYHNLND